MRLKSWIPKDFSYTLQNQFRGSAHQLNMREWGHQ